MFLRGSNAKKLIKYWHVVLNETDATPEADLFPLPCTGLAPYLLSFGSHLSSVWLRATVMGKSWGDWRRKKERR
jgi:hypothetical protein